MTIRDWRQFEVPVQDCTPSEIIALLQQLPPEARLYCLMPKAADLEDVLVFRIEKEIT